MENKLTVKDLVFVAGFSILGILCMYIIPLPFLFTPYTILISPIVQSLFMAIPFLLMGAKIQKKKAVFIYCVIWGLGGIMPYYIGMMMIAGMVGEVILSKVKDRFKGLSFSFMIAMLSHYIGGTIIPYIFIREQQFEMIKDTYGLEYAAKMKEIQRVPLIAGITIAMLVVSMIGSHIAKNFCKKHF